ncbi:unnamed protein product, partial [Mesorhabditis belari]|uniref:Small ribosomal subunit protein uS4 N-terminal domain-containing protein n=1 Tax=Mesorhabditis belari TaxID=2138241 RepID=A0AAF3EN40_9BILA
MTSLHLSCQDFGLYAPLTHFLNKIGSTAADLTDLDLVLVGAPKQDGTKVEFHEQKLPRKTDFITLRRIDQKNKQAQMMQKYHVTKREHYAVYNRLANDVRTIANKLKDLPQGESFRQEKTEKNFWESFTPSGSS